MDSPIAAYASTYSEITQHLPESLVRKVLSNPSLWQDSYPNNDLKSPGFIYHWHVPLDVMYTYADGERLEGEFTPFFIRDVKVVLWPRKAHSLDDLIPRLDPPLVMWVRGEWNQNEEPGILAWVRDSYLLTNEGKVLNTMMTKARLSKPLPHDVVAK